MDQFVSILNLMRREAVPIRMTPLCILMLIFSSCTTSGPQPEVPLRTRMQSIVLKAAIEIHEASESLPEIDNFRKHVSVQGRELLNDCAGFGAVKVEVCSDQGSWVPTRKIDANQKRLILFRVHYLQKNGGKKALIDYLNDGTFAFDESDNLALLSPDYLVFDDPR